MSEYSKKIKTPVYEIKGDKPKLSQLVDTIKTDELLKDIDAMIAPNGVKSFLRVAATRHYKFNYQAIAEYYARAPKNVQQLFEDSALVIIDFDAAIEGGFVQMNKRLMEIRDREK